MRLSPERVQDMYYLSPFQAVLLRRDGVSGIEVRLPAASVAPDDIQRRFGRLCARFPLLCTVFRTDMGPRPVQVVLRDLPVPLLDAPPPEGVWDLAEQGAVVLYVDAGDGDGPVLVWRVHPVLLDADGVQQITIAYLADISDASAPPAGNGFRTFAASACVGAGTAEIVHAALPRRRGGPVRPMCRTYAVPDSADPGATESPTARAVALWGLALARMTDAATVTVAVVHTAPSTSADPGQYGVWQTPTVTVGEDVTFVEVFRDVATQLATAAATAPQSGDGCDLLLRVGVPHTPPGPCHGFALEACLAPGPAPVWTVYFDAAVYDPALVDGLFSVMADLSAAAEHPEGCVLDPDLRGASCEVSASAEVPCEDPVAAVLAVAARRPNAPALVWGTTERTYGALADGVQAFAAAAAARRDGERPILLLTADPFHQLIGVLGAWLAGVPFVPLAAETVPARRLAVQAETRPVWVVTDAEAAAFTDPAAAGAGAFAPEAVPPESAAYVVYTSGSTGRPKGVVVPRAGLANTLAWRAGAYRMTAEDRMLHLFPFGFDGYFTSALTPLMAGACLVVPWPPGDPDTLRRLLRAGITHLLAVPSFLAAYAPLLSAEDLAGLRCISLAGEAFDPALPGRLARRDIPFVNEYGPTENSVATSAYRLRGGEDPVPVGTPVTGCRVHVVDGRGRPLPPYAVGELLLAGAGLARGYLGRPGETATCFRPLPLAGETRAYASGDLGYRDADGRLYVLGRRDDQVKIRGYRIEPGEVAHALAAVPGVREAVVQAVPGPAGPRLCAWYAGDAAEEAVRAALAARLPGYMVPERWCRLPVLPRLASGKPDGAALRAAIETRR